MHWMVIAARTKCCHTVDGSSLYLYQSQDSQKCLNTFQKNYKQIELQRIFLRRKFVIMRIMHSVTANRHSCTNDCVIYFDCPIIKTDTLHNLNITKKYVANFFERSATPTYFSNLFYQFNTKGTNINQRLYAKFICDTKNTIQHQQLYKVKSHLLDTKLDESL